MEEGGAVGEAVALVVEVEEVGAISGAVALVVEVEEVGAVSDAVALVVEVEVEVVVVETKVVADALAAGSAFGLPPHPAASRPMNSVTPTTLPLLTRSS